MSWERPPRSANNWKTLAQLTLEGFPWHNSRVLSSIARILGQTLHLVQLSLNLPLVSEKATLAELNLPALEDLTVREVPHGDSLGLLQLINVPLL